MPAPLTQLPSPYTAPQSDLTRIQGRVSQEDALFFRSVYPIRGVENFMLSTLYHSICTSLRKQGILHFTIENSNKVYDTILRHCTADLLTGQGTLSNVAGGVGSIHQPPTPPSDLSANDGKNPPGRPRNRANGRVDKIREAKKRTRPKED